PVLTLGTERHEEIPMLTTTVDCANAVTVLTKDGQWVTRASFQVRNHLKQFMSIRLPKGAILWSAFVAGQPVKPSLDKEGRVLIPLQKSNMADEIQSFPVEVIYHAQETALGLGGNRSAFLPAVDLPISQVLWSMYVPEEYRFLHFGGSMDPER